MIHREPKPEAPLFTSREPNRLGMSAKKFLALKLTPTDPNVAAGDEKRLTGQNALVLERLRRSPMTCGEALQLGIRRMAARVYDLKQHGYKVLTTPLGGGETLYTLIGESR